jgi:putative MATE family efflux protein
MVFGLLGIVAFNLVDTFFVSRLGTDELAALSFTFPVVMIIASMALGLGVGASAVISRAIGEGDHHKVQELTTDSLILAVIFGVIFVAAGLFSIDAVFRMLGANPVILHLIRQYMVIWYAGVIFIIIPMVGNNAIRATGDAVTPAVIMIFSVLLNLVLDPLFIFGIGPFPRMGLQGAAVATVIARAVTLVLAVYVLRWRHDMLTLAVRSGRNVVDSWKAILFLGVPTAATRMIAPVAMAIITRLVSTYGPAAVAGFGVASRIEFFALVLLFSLATVLGPFVGQNWGAGLQGRVERGVSMAKRFSLLWGAFMVVFMWFLARPVAGIFSSRPDVIETTVLYLRIVPIGYGAFGVMIIAAITLIVLHKPFFAAGLMLLQMVVLYIPLAFWWSSLIGIPGIFAALAVAFLISGVVAHFVLKRVLVVCDPVKC